MRRVSTLALFALVAAGCSSTAPPTTCPDTTELRARIAELEREARVGEVETRRLRREVERLRRDADHAGNSASPVAVEPISESRIVDEKPLGEAVGEQIETEEIETEEIDLSETNETSAPESSTETASPSSASSESVPTSSEALDLYDAAYAAYHEKQYRKALEGFQSYLKTYGRTDLADNAQFWIGACHKALDEPDAALDAFMRTVADYPQGNKVADALLEAGKCLERLGADAEARETWQELLRQFPDSAAAISAEQRLKGLEKKP